MTKAENKSWEQFWKKEEESMFARKNDPAPEDFIIPSPQSLPRHSKEYFESISRDDLYKLQEKCFSLTEKPMMNLQDQLNSDVRLKYGAQSITDIEVYEQTYTQYIKNLYNLGKAYYELGNIQDALAYLEEGINVNTDISDHYLLLGKIYHQLNNTKALNDLYEKANELTSLTKGKILKGLKELIDK